MLKVSTEGNFIFKLSFEIGERAVSSPALIREHGRTFFFEINAIFQF